MGAVAGTVVAAPLPGIGDGHTAQMCADPDHHQELGVLGPVVVGLGVTELGHVHLALGPDLFIGSGKRGRRKMPIERQQQNLMDYEN